MAPFRSLAASATSGWAPSDSRAARKGRNGGQATCKDCQGDEGAAARAAQQQRELQSFLFAESDGALDGKKRSFKGVERRAAMPSAAIKNAAKAEFKLGGAHRQTLAQPSLHTYVLVSKSD